MKRLSKLSWPAANWLILLVAMVGIFVAGASLLFRLSALTYHRLSWPEVLISQQSHSWHNLAANPLGGPLLVLERLTSYVSDSGTFWLRIPSIVVAAVAVALFYYVTRRWFNRFTAIITTILVTTSALFLHVSRLAATDVLYFLAPLALLAYATYSARRRADETVQLPLWVPLGLLAVGLYIPSFMWLLAVVILVQPTFLARPWQQSSVGMRISSIALGIFLLVPLMSALARHPGLLVQEWLGIGPIGSVGDVVHRFLQVPYNLFVSGPTNRVLWLGHIPIMPIALTVLVALGIYELVTKRRRQGLLLASLLLVSWVIIAIGGVAPLALLAGPLFVAVAAGIRHLSDQWFRVFPRNPFARSLGYAVIGVFCASMVAYGWHSYFVAWPHDPATHKVFTYNLTSDSISTASSDKR